MKRARLFWCTLGIIGTTAVLGRPLAAQEPPGPQTSAPPAVEPPAPPARTASSEKIMVPAGTRFAVVLQNGVSTRTAKPGDAVYLQTSFPVTQDNRIVIPVGSYIRGSILEAKRPGRVKGRGEMRLRLDTLILPNGYTVNLNAAATSGDTGGKEKIDPEGKVEGSSNKGGDVATIAKTAGSGAAIGAIADRSAKGAGIGAGIGGLAGLAAVLLTRGPEAELRRGATLDVVLERGISLEADKIPFNNTGQMPRIPGPGRRRHQ